MEGYPNLARDFGWDAGVHKAPKGYSRPWLVVTRDGTVGAWTRKEARKIWAKWIASGELEYAISP